MVVHMFKKIALLTIALLALHAQSIPIVILGGGIAGMSAALQVSQAGYKPLVVMGPTPGGIITVSHDVQNWPGDLTMTGSELADKLEKQLQTRGVELMNGVVTSVDFSKRPFTLHIKNPILPDETTTIQAESCIIATGSTPNTLLIPGEEKLLYKKIFTCAPCDGLQFKDQIVAVIGGGESALVEAHYLSNIAKAVYLIVRGQDFKTIQPALKERLLAKDNVKVMYETTVHEFIDDPRGIKLRLPKETLLVQGAFLAIGSKPNTVLFQNSIKLDSKGYIVLTQGQLTSVPGVFAAGDVSDPIYRQATTATGDATKAALDAIQFISSAPSLTSISNQPVEALTEISDYTQFKTIVQSSDQPVIAYFYLTNCGPCRSFKPLYQQWSTDYSSVARFIKINGRTCPPCASTYKVDGFPTVIIFKNGKEIKRVIGTSGMIEIIKYLDKLKG